MAGMNILAAQGFFSMAASAASGYSSLALSYTFPRGIGSLVGGSVVICIKNMSTTDPVHMEVRSLWTDMQGVSQTTTLGLGFSGASALTVQKLALVNSSESVAFPYTNIIGSALQVIVMNAISGTSSAAPGSGTVSIWAL